MRIVFHGSNAATFRPGIEALLDGTHEIRTLSDRLDGAEEPDALAAADVVVGARYGRGDPRLSARLFQVPGAGCDAVDFGLLPPDCAVCNCFGHERAIAEYVMAALLARHVPLADADARLRRGDWRYGVGEAGGPRSELGSTAIGIVGHGHIGRELAVRAAAFGMTVHVANRSPVAGGYAATCGLDALAAMFGRVDAVVTTLPLTEETRGLIGAAELAAMRPDAVILNVGRGPVIDEDALFEALRDGRIGGAVIDTWYVYPSAEDPAPMPGRRPFHELSNVTMTPHMCAWTAGTVERRRAAIAGNVNALAAGRELANVVRSAGVRTAGGS
jgi:phosphoglycerate dehydrogenase-like enzyme